MNLSHIKKLEYMLHYQSPSGKYHLPRKIEPGFEEVEVIVSGYGEFMKDGKAVRFGPGSSVWYYEGETVEVTSDNEAPYETVVFAYKISSVPKQRMPFYSEWDNVQGCNSFCFKAYDLYKLPNADTDFLRTCSYARLIWEASEFNKQRKIIHKPLPVEKAVQFLEAHFTEDIKIPEIAYAAGVSSSHLHLLFRDHLQTSPIQFLLQLRLNNAQKLLSNSSLPVKQICFDSGFSDLKNFCSFFKRKNNLTPTQYRSLTSGR